MTKRPVEMRIHPEPSEGPPGKSPSSVGHHPRQGLVTMQHIPEPTVAPTSKPPASDSRPFGAGSGDGYTLGETAAYHTQAVQRIQDNARSNGWRLSLPDVVALDSIKAFLDRIARNDLGIFAVGGPRVYDPEPQPGDGPEYDANHRAWERRQHGK